MHSSGWETGRGKAGSRRDGWEAGSGRDGWGGWGRHGSSMLGAAAHAADGQRCIVPTSHAGVSCSSAEASKASCLMQNTMRSVQAACQPLQGLLQGVGRGGLECSCRRTGSVHCTASPAWVPGRRPCASCSSCPPPPPPPPLHTRTHTTHPRTHIHPTPPDLTPHLRHLHLDPGCTPRPPPPSPFCLGWCLPFLAACLAAAMPAPPPHTPTSSHPACSPGPGHTLLSLPLDQVSAYRPRPVRSTPHPRFCPSAPLLLCHHRRRRHRSRTAETGILAEKMQGGMEDMALKKASAM